MNYPISLSILEAYVPSVKMSHKKIDDTKLIELVITIFQKFGRKNVFRELFSPLGAHCLDKIIWDIWI